MATIPHPQRPQQRAALGAVEALLASARLAMRRRLMAVPSVQPRHSGRLQAAVAAHLGAAPEPLPQPSAAAVLAAAAELLHQPSADLSPPPPPLLVLVGLPSVQAAAEAGAELLLPLVALEEAVVVALEAQAVGGVMRAGAGAGNPQGVPQRKFVKARRSNSVKKK